MKRCPWLLVILLCGCSQAAVITDLKPLYSGTEIAVDGRARAVIICPESAELQTIADTLRDRIAALSGAKLEISADTSLVDESWAIDHQAVGGRTLLAIGNCNNNRLLAVLFGAGYTAESSVFPGPNGYVIRTVHDPFADGTNVLVLAGSDTAGVARAVEVFLERHAAPLAPRIAFSEPIVDIEFVNVPTRFYPTVNDWQSSKRQPQHSSIEYFRQFLQQAGLMDGDGAVISRPEGTLLTVLGAIGRMAQSYFWNGDPALPPLMKEVLDRNRLLLANVPRRVEMEGAAGAYMHWWDVVEELPIWTDDDRLQITNAFLADASQGYEKRAANQLVQEGYVQVVDENHGTNSALNTYAGWHYFDKYYDLPESKYWMDVVRAVFAGQSSSFQVLEDAAGYLCYCPRHAMSYALSSADLTYFTRGIARSQAEYIAQVCINNLGLASGFGDCSSLVEPGAFEAVSLAAWYYRDPSLTWVMQNQMPQACGLRTFTYPIPYDLTVQPEVPTQWNGMSVFPIYRQTLPKGRGSKTFVYDPPESAGPQWFNKIVFREGWSPDDQYLLLDGAGKFTPVEGYPSGPAGHMHSDVNSIINFTAEGRMWLVDHTYSARGIQDHSALYIARDGIVSYPQHEAKLQEAADGGAVAMSRSLFEGFSGADWERAVFWRPGRPFVVLDRAIAHEPGHYVARCSFRGLGEHEFTAGRLRLTQADRYCDIVPDAQARSDLETMQFPTGEAWQAYPHAEPVAKVLQQDKSAALQPGQMLTFATLVHAADSTAELDAVTLTPVSDSAVLVREAGGETLCGIGSPPGDGAEAGTYALGADVVLYAGLRRLGPVDAPLLTASAPVTLCVNGGQGGWLETPEPVDLILPGQVAPVHLAAGRHELPKGITAPALAELVKTAMTRATERAAARTIGGAADDQAAFGWAAKPVKLGTGIAETAIADLDGDGVAEWLVAGEAGVSAFAPDGTARWTFATEQPCRSVAAGDINGDGAPEVVAGCDDTNVYALSARGEQLWSFTCKPTTGTIGLPAWVDWVRIADLDGDGRPEIVVGANQVHCLDGAGSLKWERYLRVARGMTCGDFLHGEITDITGDGAPEVLALFLYSYNQALAFDAAGNIVLPPDYDNDRKFGVNIDLPQGLMMANVFGDDRRHFVLAGASRVYVYWADGEHIGFPGFKAEGSCVALASLARDAEPPIIFSADNMGSVTARRAKPPRPDEWIHFDTVWSLVIGHKISRLTTADVDGDGAAELLIGHKSGAVRVVDALTGETEALSAATGSPVVGFDRDGARVLVLHADGLVEMLAVGK